MTYKHGLILFWVILLLIVLFVCTGVVSYRIGYDKGYQEGQINYSLGKIRYTVLEGKMIHFFGSVKNEESEP